MTPAPVTISDRAPRLANGWEWVPLADVAQLATGHTPDRAIETYWNGGIPWISLTEIRELDGRIADRTQLSISEAGVRHSSSVILPPGTVCLSRTASIGFVTVMGSEMATSQDFVNWVCGPLLHPEYLMRALIASRQHIRSLSTGSTHKTLYMRVAERLRVLLPPIEEQRRIAAVLDKADRLRAKRRAYITQLDAMREAIFDDLFGNARSSTVRIGEICHVKGGKRLPKGAEYSTEPTPYRYLRVTDIHDGRVAADDLRFISPEVHRRVAQYVVRTGDVVISIAGSIGQVSEIPLTLDGVNLTENAAKLTSRASGHYEAAYLAAALRTPVAQAQIRQRTGQVTIGKLALFRIEEIEIPLPPIEEQREFLMRCTCLQRSADLAEASQRQLSQLFDSLQHHAFSGAL